MRNISKLFLAPLTLSAAMNLCADPATASEKFYAGMSIGISKTQAMQNNSLPIFSTLSPLFANKIGDIHFKTGNDARLRLGYEQQNTRTELEAVTFYSGYKRLNANQRSVEFSAGRTKALLALLNVYYDFKQVNPDIFPFAGVGAGMTMIKNRLFLLEGTANRLDQKLICQGITGLMFNIMPRTSLSMDYRYFVTQRLKAFNQRLKSQSLNLGFLVRF